MGEGPLVRLVAEDRGHEAFVRALVERLAGEEGRVVRFRAAEVRGGHGRALTELRGFQRLLLRARGALERPDVLVVVIDGNCKGWQARKREVEAIVERHAFPEVVVACPDPHVERWLQADPETFQRVVGGPPRPDPGKCERALYKSLIRDAILEAGNVIVGGIEEFTPDLVEAMDLYRAGRRQPSLRHLVEGLRGALRRAVRRDEP